MIIRLATEQDIAELIQLYVAFHDFHAQYLPGRLKTLGTNYDTTQLKTDILDLLTNSEAALFVGELDDQLVGIAEIYLRDEPPSPFRHSAPHGYLQSLFVVPSLRGQGLGRQLVTACHDWAQKQGAVEIKLETWDFPQGPFKFYQKIGYQTLKQTLIYPLNIGGATHL